MEGNKTAITVAELKTVLNSLKEQQESMQSTYNSLIKPVLDSSSQCFQVAGLDYTEIESIFNKTFSSVDNKFASLINVLENDVIGKYSELALALKKLFGNDFATQLNDLLGSYKEGK